MEREAFEYIEKIDAMGGIVRSIELGFPQKEIAESAYRYQRQLESGDKVMVGVNRYGGGEEPPIEVLRVSADVERRQIERTRARNRARAAETVRERLAAVRDAAKNGTNLMPPMIDAVKAQCTVGEISDVFREVFGVYRDPGWI
jgi:methylmalonyl-CoA mutase N-terminal domain/subunit